MTLENASGERIRLPVDVAMDGVMALEEPDHLRLRAAWERAIDCAGPGLANQLFPHHADPEAVHLVESYCRFGHIGSLVFPTSVDALVAELRRIGLEVPAPMRSRLVRQRLIGRYGIPPQDVDVTLTRLTWPQQKGVCLELFFFPRAAAALTPGIVRNERNRELESHLAVQVLSPDWVVLGQLMDALGRQGLVLEGGGLVAGEGTEDSSTTLYFVAAGRAPGVPHRIELCCPGDFSSLLTHRQIDRAAVRAAYAG